MDDADAAAVTPMAFEDLPYECIVECFVGLSAADLAAVSQVSMLLKEAAAADFLWRNLCVAGSHGQQLDFQQDLGAFNHPDARPLQETEEPSPDAAWKEIYRKSRETLRTTVCIDLGRGYTKYELASESSPRQIQICQPGAEASAEGCFALAFRRMKLRTTDISEFAAIISEPFRLASSECERERAAWRYETERRILQGFRLKAVCIVDSASLCLFAHNLTSGVVVNVGFANTYVVPVLRGHVIRRAVRVMRLGGAGLTQFMAQLLEMRGHEATWQPEMGIEQIADVRSGRNHRLALIPIVACLCS